MQEKIEKLKKLFNALTRTQKSFKEVTFVLNKVNDNSVEIVIKNDMVFINDIVVHSLDNFKDVCFKPVEDTEFNFAAYYNLFLKCITLEDNLKKRRRSRDPYQK